MEAEFFRAGGQTDRQTDTHEGEKLSLFSILRTCLKTEKSFISIIFNRPSPAPHNMNICSVAVFIPTHLVALHWRSVIYYIYRQQYCIAAVAISFRDLALDTKK